jgi:APA family basic amino acid/polyamine antiporter
MTQPGASRRFMGRFDATMLVVGSMIGSGIFIVSAESARLLGTGGRLLLVWTAAGALTLLAALACAELATMFPEAGGPYVFFREAYGPMAGFLYGWTMAFVVQTGTIAAVCVAFSKFLGVLVPSVTGWAAKGAAPAPPEGGAFLVAFVLALVGPAFSQSAWTNVTFPGAEVKDPGRTFPVALLAGCALVAGLYVLANMSYLNVLGWDGVARAPESRVGTAAAERLLPGAGGTAMAAAILVSTFGCANGLILSGGRVVYALARDGFLPGGAAGLNAAGVPGFALVLQAAWASVLVLSGTYSELLRYVVSVEFVVLVLLVAAVPVLRRKRPDAPRPYRASGHPITTGLFLAGASAVVAVLAVASPGTTWPGYVLVLLGIPVFLLRRARTRAR